MSIHIAKAGNISLIPGVVRDCDRRQFVVRSRAGWVPVRAGDVVIRWAGRSWVMRFFGG